MCLRNILLLERQGGLSAGAIALPRPDSGVVGSDAAGPCGGRAAYGVSAGNWRRAVVADAPHVKIHYTTLISIILSLVQANGIRRPLGKERITIPFG